MTSPILAYVDEDLADMIPEFLESIQKNLSEIEGFLEVAAFDKIKAIAHQFAGSGESYGFPFISQLGKTIELEAEEENRAVIATSVQEIRDCLDRVEIKFVPEDEL